MSFRTLCMHCQRAATAVLDALFPPSGLERTARAMSPADLLPFLRQRDGDGVTVLFDYREKVVKELISLLKYRKDRHAAELFAAILHDVLSEAAGDAVLFNDSESVRLPILIPIPLSPKRRRERGYNQMEILAEALVAHAGPLWYDYAKDILIKEKETPPQTSLSHRAERMENLRDAFCVAANAAAKDALAGRTVILLDDVTTTGATLREARRALREARGGPRRIIAVALAH